MSANYKKLVSLLVGAGDLLGRSVREIEKEIGVEKCALAIVRRHFYVPGTPIRSRKLLNIEFCTLFRVKLVLHPPSSTRVSIL